MPRLLLRPYARYLGESEMPPRGQGLRDIGACTRDLFHPQAVPILFFSRNHRDFPQNSYHRESHSDKARFRRRRLESCHAKGCHQLLQLQVLDTSQPSWTRPDRRLRIDGVEFSSYRLRMVWRFRCPYICRAEWNRNLRFHL